MGLFEIFSLIFFFSSFLLIFPYIFFEINIFASLKTFNSKPKAFNKTYTIPGIISIVELTLFVLGFVFLFVSCVNGSFLNEVYVIWGIALCIGMLIGVILGAIYWKKVRRPFFLKYYAEDFKKYEKELLNVPGTIRVSYLQWIFINSPVLSFTGLGASLGILLSYML